MEDEMNKVVALVIFIAAGVGLFGCAGYSVNKNGEGEGFDVFRPEPYLLVTTVKDNSGAYAKEAKIIWLPNYKERYRVSTSNFLAKSDITFKITDGWKLTEITDKSSSDELAKKLVDLVPELISGKTRTPAATKSSVTLYRLIFDDNGVFTAMEPLSGADGSLHGNE